MSQKKTGIIVHVQFTCTKTKKQKRWTKRQTYKQIDRTKLIGTKRQKRQPTCQS